MDEPDETELPEAPEGFKIDSPERAAWAVDKVLSARERAARIKEHCAALVAQAEREAETTAAFFAPMLEAWARANLPAKGKTIKLPTGSLSFRTVPGGPRVVDDAAALAWARDALPAAVRVVESLDKAAVKDYVAATGELPPGVELTASEERFGMK